MATMTNDFSLLGRFGNFTAYKSRGSNNIIVRTRGGGSKHKIKTAPSCAEVRKRNTEFGGTAQCGKMIKKAIPAVQLLADPFLSAGLTSLSRRILVLDTVNAIGQRNILVSNNKSVLAGFQYNRNLYLETVIRKPIFWSVLREELSASITIPALVAGSTLYIPGKYPMIRLVAALGSMPDMLYTSHGMCGYEATHENLDVYSKNVYTPWGTTSANFAEQTLSLQLSKDALPDDTCSLVLAIGVEFGMPVNKDCVQPINHSGCAKILAVA